MWIRRGLRNEDLRSAFDEMMGPNVGHQLCAWQDLLAELLLDRVELLSSRQRLCPGHEGRRAYGFIVVHLHLGGLRPVFSERNRQRAHLTASPGRRCTSKKVLRSGPEGLWMRPPCAGWRLESQLSRLDPAGSTKIWGGKGERGIDCSKPALCRASGILVASEMISDDSSPHSPTINNARSPPTSARGFPRVPQGWRAACRRFLRI